MKRKFEEISGGTLWQVQGRRGAQSEMALTETEKRRLINAAVDARSSSYSPYSRFSVGAAILAKSGKIYTGANVENASYGLAICAERSAAVKAVNDGERVFEAVACVGG